MAYLKVLNFFCLKYWRLLRAFLDRVAPHMPGFEHRTSGIRRRSGVRLKLEQTDADFNARFCTCKPQYSATVFFFFFSSLSVAMCQSRRSV
jgi:hypothetical protein